MNARHDGHDRYVDVIDSIKLETFYAGGKSGKYVRADGQGGVMERGYYGRRLADGHCYAVIGPFSTRRKAEIAIVKKTG